MTENSVSSGAGRDGSRLRELAEKWRRFASEPVQVPQGFNLDEEAARTWFDGARPPQWFDSANHHNALACPYCNPDNLSLSKQSPQASIDAVNEHRAASDDGAAREPQDRIADTVRRIRFWLVGGWRYNGSTKELDYLLTQELTALCSGADVPTPAAQEPKADNSTTKKI